MGAKLSSDSCGQCCYCTSKRGFRQWLCPSNSICCVQDAMVLSYELIQMCADLETQMGDFALHIHSIRQIYDQLLEIIDEVRDPMDKTYPEVIQTFKELEMKYLCVVSVFRNYLMLLQNFYTSLKKLVKLIIFVLMLFRDRDVHKIVIMYLSYFVIWNIDKSLVDLENGEKRMVQCTLNLKVEVKSLKPFN